MVHLIDITGRLNEYTDQLIEFIYSLSSEKKYFQSIDKKMILNSSLVIAAVDNNKIVGICGLEKKYFIQKTYIILKNEYHGKGLGKRLILERLGKAKKNHDIIISVIKKENLKTLKLHHSLGSLYMGKKDEHEYVASILNKRGYIWYFLLIILLFALKMKDWIELKKV